MAYCTNAHVIDMIGTNYDSSNDLTSAEIDVYITRADALIDAESQPNYYPFNATGSTKTDGTDTYTTPKLVQMCSIHLATSYSMMQLRAMVPNNTLAEAALFHMDQGTVLLNKLRDPAFKLSPHTWRNYTLTFGTSAVSWSLGSEEAFIEPTALDSGDPPNILEDTVRIGSTTSTTRTDVTAAQLQQARLGIEYTVRWDAKYQRYVFTANDPKLYSNTTLKVTFEWDYRRDRGREPHFSGVIFSG